MASSAVIERLKEIPKSDLVTKVANMRATMARYRVKEHAVRGAKAVVGTLAAGAGGVVAGGLQLKLPHIPKTPIRTDLAGAALLAGACAINLFDEMTPHVLDIAKGMAGAGMSEVTKSFLKAHGVTQVSGEDLL